MKKYELIIFDCDGTLVDSEPLTNALISDMVNECGINMTMEESLHRFAGKTIMDIISYVQKINDSIDAIQFESEYRERCLDLFNAKLEAIDGVHQFLASLEIPYCIASNGPRVKMNITLPATGLDQYFGDHNTFSAYDINAWKPSPELFQHATTKMGISPDKALVIEDTWSGVMGAMNGDIDVWAFNPHRDDRLYLRGIPNFIHMSSIRNCLKRYI